MHMPADWWPTDMLSSKGCIIMASKASGHWQKKGQRKDHFLDFEVLKPTVHQGKKLQLHVSLPKTWSMPYPCRDAEKAPGPQLSGANSVRRHGPDYDDSAAGTANNTQHLDGQCNERDYRDQQCHDFAGWTQIRLTLHGAQDERNLAGACLTDARLL